MAYIPKRGLHYENTKIFSIRSSYYDKIYIGATTDKDMNIILSKYMYRFRLWKLGFAKKEPIFLILDLGDCTIKELGKFKCETKQEVNQKLEETKKKLAEQGCEIFNPKIDKPERKFSYFDRMKVEEPLKEKVKVKRKRRQKKPRLEKKEKLDVILKKDVILEIT